MGFLGPAGRKSDESERVTALVAEAEAPPQGAPPFGTGSHGSVRIVIGTASGPTSVPGTFRFREERWLVTGMEVAVTIDPARPDRFEVDWDAIPSMQDRVAANDPTLADPLGAGRRVAEAQGLTPADTGSARSDRFREALEHAAQAPAPEGQLRAVVLVVTIRGRYQSDDSDVGTSRSGVVFDRNSNAVLAVNVPGRAPYAVLAKKFKFPQHRHDLLGGGLPALVSAGDPKDIEVLWDELPSLDDQPAARLSDGIAAAEARYRPVEAVGQQIRDAVGQTGLGEAIPAAGSAALDAAAPQMRQLAADSARRALQYVSDPAMRKMMVAQYRSAGIVLDEDDQST